MQNRAYAGAVDVTTDTPLRTGGHPGKRAWRLLKGVARPTILVAAALFVRLLNLVRQREGVVLCGSPTPEKNRGDQALLVASLTHFARNIADPVHIVATSGLPIRVAGTGRGRTIHADLFLAFQTEQILLAPLRFLKLLLGKRRTFVIGADVLDGAYNLEQGRAILRMARLSALAGVDTRIVSFSVNGNVPALLRSDFARSARTVPLFPREQVSLERLNSWGIQHARLAADVAFLLEPAEVESSTSMLQEFVRAHRGRLVGLNFTDVVLGPVMNPDAFAERMAAACARVATEGWRFLLIPHDEPERVPYLRKLFQAIEGHAPGIAHFVDPLPSAAQIKRLAGDCTHVFTCKMHLAIATLGMGRPVTCFPYQGKFEGLLAHFALSGAMAHLDHRTLAVERLVDLLLARLRDSESEAEVISKRLPEVVRLSRASLSLD